MDVRQSSTARPSDTNFPATNSSAFRSEGVAAGLLRRNHGVQRRGSAPMATAARPAASARHADFNPSQHSSSRTSDPHSHPISNAEHKSSRAGKRKRRFKGISVSAWTDLFWVSLVTLMALRLSGWLPSHISLDFPVSVVEATPYIGPLITRPLQGLFKEDGRVDEAPVWVLSFYKGCNLAVFSAILMAALMMASLAVLAGSAAGQARAAVRKRTALQLSKLLVAISCTYLTTFAGGWLAPVAVLGPSFRGFRILPLGIFLRYLYQLPALNAVTQECLAVEAAAASDITAQLNANGRNGRNGNGDVSGQAGGGDAGDGGGSATGMEVGAGGARCHQATPGTAASSGAKTPHASRSRKGAILPPGPLLVHCLSVVFMVCGRVFPVLGVFGCLGWGLTGFVSFVRMYKWAKPAADRRKRVSSASETGDTSATAASPAASATGFGSGRATTGTPHSNTTTPNTSPSSGSVVGDMRVDAASDIIRMALDAGAAGAAADAQSADMQRQREVVHRVSESLQQQLQALQRGSGETSGSAQHQADVIVGSNGASPCSSSDASSSSGGSLDNGVGNGDGGDADANERRSSPGTIDPSSVLPTPDAAAAADAEQRQQQQQQRGVSAIVRGIASEQGAGQEAEVPAAQPASAVQAHGQPAGEPLAAAPDSRPATSSAPIASTQAAVPPTVSTADTGAASRRSLTSSLSSSSSAARLRRILPEANSAPNDPDTQAHLDQSMDTAHAANDEQDARLAAWGVFATRALVFCLVMENALQVAWTPTMRGVLGGLMVLVELIATIVAPLVFFQCHMLALRENEATRLKLCVAEARVTAEEGANDSRRKFLRYVFHEARVPANALRLGERSHVAAWLLLVCIQ